MNGDGPPAGVHRRRVFLFLQGLASPMFADLGRVLSARGHVVRRINLCFGDRLFWPLPADDYRGKAADWAAHIAAYLGDRDVTDLILFGDCRPYHLSAIRAGRSRGIRIHVFEEGYTRPNWITLERDGTNGHSTLPREAWKLRDRAGRLSDPPASRPAPDDMARRARWDILYNVATTMGRPLYPGFLRHRPLHPFIEYAGWIRRLGRRRGAAARAEQAVRSAMMAPGGFYLAPLQLDSDYQLRVHSDIGSVTNFLEVVVRSFAANAPADTRLLVKTHPLDNGLTDWSAHAAGIATTCGVANRVSCAEGGDLPALLETCRSVVLINSTVGFLALKTGRPVIALGRAIYAMAGLTFQGPLDRFWSEAVAPDTSLAQALERVVLHDTQVNGGFFHPDSIALAIAGSARRLEAAGEVPGA